MKCKLIGMMQNKTQVFYLIRKIPTRSFMGGSNFLIVQIFLMHLFKRL